ncbi:BCH1 (YMR237W) and BUD7 (YOR299W) [Zygosaccharomyces parabailii]|uniref:BN860_14180g1_1 n=1 Tax=Zygosaccharomyces bailii (strain CLIB 213 / ATCC 58445 / CBS 680 / BCRC 21525 / NBRC 1098 / NCYC 1416 / NRRL Y-2227) TaxID=1333698 RepID=A0A8J2T5H3_ZYGB2|nr:BCH1 (YMR237W) and BUD7 (YOR299W) [Zygosaccharomyces parabailii]AQZ17815.1 BCH1 (YMR237W) and BUD7 (YOR299W) [Zygosaccharomyces parabailii]CDF88606.1 BN860_14180g1_1 [Zygosaccharomyces bailii CLIB 213]CDH14517.1 probable Bud site selection protein 7 [Zygosaccharomyces bailii ISA1307]
MFSQGSIPEVKEEAVGYSLSERRLKIPQFQDLGPPDLITMLKYIPSSSSNAADKSHHHGAGAGSASTSATPQAAGDAADGAGSTAQVNGTAGSADQSALLTGLHTGERLKGEIGTFFYCLGADTSDPTSIAVFLKSIADTISDTPQVWFGKSKNFSVARISLSTWNTFRKCDVSIVVHIPGTVQTYILDSNSEQLQIGSSPADHDLVWTETFFSGIVRSVMLMKDNSEEGEVQNLVETYIVNPLTSGKLGNVVDIFIDLFPTVYERGHLLGGPCQVTNVTRTNNYLVETLVEIVRLTHSVEKCQAMLEKLIAKNPEAVVILVRVLLTNDREVDGMKLINETLASNDPEREEQPNSTTTPEPPAYLDYKSELLCVQTQFLIDIKKDYKLAEKTAQAAVNCSPSEFTPWSLLAKAYIRLGDVENALLTLNACPMTPLKEKYALKRVVPIPTEGSLHLPLPVDVILDEVSSLNPQDIQREHRSADPVLSNLAASNLKSVFQIAYRLLTEIVRLTGWETLLKYRSKIFVMEEEYQGSSDDINNSASAKASSVNVNETQDSQSVPHQEDGGEANTAESAVDTNNSTHALRSKRLCERWLDNLFMLLYEDLKTYTLWQTEQLYFEAQYSKYNKLTFEWELFGLCARRLGHYPEAARAFQKGLSQRFSSECARRLLEYCVKERQQIRDQSSSPNTEYTSSQIITRINELDHTIIDLCVKVCCWNHRWYIEFSIKLIDALSEVIQDMGLTKVSNEIAARYSEQVSQLMKDNMLDFFADYTNGYFDN